MNRQKFLKEQLYKHDLEYERKETFLKYPVAS